MGQPIYRFTAPQWVDGVSIYARSGLTHEWMAGHHPLWADMMRSRCGLSERLKHLETEGSLGRCKRCARRHGHPQEQSPPGVT